MLSLRASLHPPSQYNSPSVNQSGSQRKAQPGDECLRMAVLWRLQAVQPLCGLMRQFPDEFGVGEWLMTLVTLCLSPVCQGTSSTGSDGCGGDELYQFMLDFAAITNESITTSMRKHTLGLLKSVTPLLRTLKQSQNCTGVLGRLFPFDVATALTCDVLQPGSSVQSTNGLDNPWVWIDSLEFVPLESLKTTAIAGGGLEGMTPFTLRGMVEQENMARGEKTLAAGPATTGYLANVQRNSAGSKPEVGIVRSLQYLENPYFPMQPAFLFPLAETPIPWQAFAAKRMRMDSETRLVWRYQCHAAFGN
ncbi:hypothetical protein LPJ56_006455 [Coemansia sp. RSA 2599]|nr:hypothetical protein LPJ75_006491 [Coemansia sp. RSA 2598]KAJ1805993.1 hypothetical protein LPJ56_006455 [Coemansia sp. RSA 2599]